MNRLTEYLKDATQALSASDNFKALSFTDQLELVNEISEAMVLSEEPKAQPLHEEALEILIFFRENIKGRNMQAVGLSFACLSSLILAEGVAEEMAKRRAGKTDPEPTTTILEPVSASQTPEGVEKSLEEARKAPRYDLSQKEGVLALLDSSKSQKEWNDNCAQVKENYGGRYPDWWHAEVILAGKIIWASNLPRVRRPLDSRPGLTDG